MTWLLVDDQRGQVLPLFVFFFTLVFGIFLISHDIGRLATRRVQLQVAADTAAMAGARAQSLALEFIAAVNDFVEIHMARLIADLANIEDPEVWGDIIDQIDAIQACHGLQEDVERAYASGMPVAVAGFLTASQSDNADWAFNLPLPIEGISAAELSLKEPLWTYPLGGLDLRKGLDNIDPVPFYCNTTIEEKVTGVALNDETSGSFLGWDIPAMTAFGSAKPYWILGGEFLDPAHPYFGFGEDPRSSKMNSVASLVSMVLPGPFWTARMVESGDLKSKIGVAFKTAEGMAKWVNTQMTDFWGAKGKEILVEELKKQLEEMAGKERNNAPGCIFD